MSSQSPSCCAMTRSISSSSQSPSFGSLQTARETSRANARLLASPLLFDCSFPCAPSTAPADTSLLLPCSLL